MDSCKIFTQRRVEGNVTQDSYPFLIGFTNALKSAMSYTGSKTLEEFKDKK